VCVRVGFVMFGCVYVWVYLMCRCEYVLVFYVWLCVCVGFVMFGCVGFVRCGCVCVCVCEIL